MGVGAISGSGTSHQVVGSYSELYLTQLWFSVIINVGKRREISGPIGVPPIDFSLKLNYGFSQRLVYSYICFPTYLPLLFSFGLLSNFISPYLITF